MQLTHRDLKRFVDDQLVSIILDSAQRTAERNRLIAHCLGISPEQMMAYPETPVPYNDAFDQLLEMLYQRVEYRTPLQHLLGQGDFYGLSFAVTPDTLIPRPETELLVEKALEILNAQPEARVLDLGTGSGCIAIALKIHSPQSDVVAVDASFAALAVAHKNAQTHRAAISFLHGSWFEPLTPQARFDLIVSNPPYIDPKEAGTLSPEVLSEPHTALFSPQDPLDLIGFLLAQARDYLSPNGQMLIELGAGQGQGAILKAQQLGYAATVILDYAGHDRILHACLLA